MKKLGFGLMRLPLLDSSDPKSLDIEQINKMVDTFIERGFTYFDTAWMYCAFKSEEIVKTCLVNRHPRESFTLATKLHAGFIRKAEDVENIFNTQLEKTGAGYFDYYLIHDVNKHHYKIYQKYNCFDWLREKKRQGIVKKIGFSFHDDAEFLEKVLCENPDMDFVQLQINYLDWESSGIQSRRCYEVARKYNKPIVVMEPVKGGTLAKVPQNVEEMFKKHNPSASVASWAVRFAASLDGVFMVLSGMSDTAQLEDNVSYMENFIELSEKEKEIVSLATDEINSQITVPCTTCRYCTDCPQGINIPTLFSLYNTDKMETSGKDWTSGYEYYHNHCKSCAYPEKCIECGSCESVCPQHLPIIKLLKDISAHFAQYSE